MAVPLQDPAFVLPAPTRAGVARRLLDGVEARLDHVFGARCNPLRRLGAVAMWLFWVVAITGVYLYAAFETRADGAYESVERLSAGGWPLGGFARSLHRYAADALVVVVLAHAVREWLRGRYAHLRRFAWITGIAALVLVYCTGVNGFWLAFDRVGQYSFTATMEWLDVLPFFGGLMHQLHAGTGVSDRLFSLFIFLHLGLPLAFLAAAWLHVQRLSRPATQPPRPLWIGLFAALSLLGLVAPVRSADPADLSTIAATLPLDWFFLGVHPLADRLGAEGLWLVVGTVLLGLAALPFAGRAARAPRAPAARVSEDDCSGCGHCVDDCPYAAVSMARRASTGTAYAVVDPALCAACGICTGACPSSTPFRKTGALASGIELPHRTVAALRSALDAALSASRDGGPRERRVVVFGCEGTHAGALAAVADRVTAAVGCTCAGALPPSFIDYALRSGAAGVVVLRCRDGGCEFRLGERWVHERLAGEREPALRASARGDRVRLLPCAADDIAPIHAAIDALRRRPLPAHAPLPPAPRTHEDRDHARHAA